MEMPRKKRKLEPEVVILPGQPPTNAPLHEDMLADEEARKRVNEILRSEFTGRFSEEALDFFLGPRPKS
jgi:hypothetical protein